MRTALEPAAITGVMSREVANFRTFWKATTFSSVLEPVVYLLAFGLGLGATIVDRVDGLEYVEFVGTGMVATAVIFSSALPAMFGTFVKHRFQRTYDAILAAPVDVEELVTAEMLWIGHPRRLLRLLPAAGHDGLRARPGARDAARAALLLRHGARLRGLRDRGRGDASRRSTSSTTSPRWWSRRCSSSPAPSSRSTSLPEGFQVAAQLNPLHHLVELVRHASFGFEAVDLIRFAVLVVFAVALWRVAVRRMTRRLVD